MSKKKSPLKLPKDKKRSKTIAVRVDAATFKSIRKAAEIDGLSLGSELLHGWECYNTACIEENLGVQREGQNE